MLQCRGSNKNRNNNKRKGTTLLLLLLQRADSKSDCVIKMVRKALGMGEA